MWRVGNGLDNPVLRSLEQSSDTGRKRIAREEPGVREHETELRAVARLDPAVWARESRPWAAAREDTVEESNQGSLSSNKACQFCIEEFGEILWHWAKTHRKRGAGGARTKARTRATSLIWPWLCFCFWHHIPFASATGMAISNGAPQTEVQRLRDIAWKAIGTATVDGAVRERYWRAWENHCRLFPLNERGQNLPPNNVEDMLLTFAVAVREGQYGLGGRIQVQSVEVIFLFWNCNRKFQLYIDVSILYNIKMLTNTKMQLNSPCKLTEVIVNDVKILQLTVLVPMVRKSPLFQGMVQLDAGTWTEICAPSLK